jgi:O-antigen/teichoic acid export membrane protein
VLAAIAAARLGAGFWALLFVTADRVIPLLLGPQWVASVPLFRALAPAAAADAVTISAGWIFISLGGPRARWASASPAPSSRSPPS